MSHPVTVTPRDTSVTPSRHIRPSLEGGVYVTGAQLCGEGWERPPHHLKHVDNQQHRSRSIPRRWQPGRAERVTHGFPACGRANTAVYSTTRQRACWPLFVRRADIKTAHVHRLRHCGSTPLPFVIPSRQCLVSAGRVCTRALSRPLTLLEADARASRARRNAEATRNPCKAPSQKNPAGTGWGGKPGARSILDLILLHSAALSKIWAGPVSKSWGTNPWDLNSTISLSSIGHFCVPRPMRRRTGSPINCAASTRPAGMISKRLRIGRRLRTLFAAMPRLHTSLRSTATS
jgi:hypothetical protein